MRRAVAMLVIVAAGATGVGACKRTSPADAPLDAAPADADADAAAPAATPTATATTTAKNAATTGVTSPSDVSRAPFVATEATRTRVASLAALVALDHAVGDAARRHFATDGGASTQPGALDVQAVDLSSAGRRAWLVEDAAHRAAPFVAVVDAKGGVLWSRDRPTGGIAPPVGRLAIASGPSDRVLLAACDPPTSSLAARIWDDDGSPFADFQAIEVDGCADATALYWSHHGWILVASTASGARAQLLAESGRLAWNGSSGAALGAAWRAPPPVSIALDTTESFVAVQYARSPDHALAFRYDAQARPLWPAPVDLGEVRKLPAGSERIPLGVPAPQATGVVRAKLADGAVVDIGSSGDLLRR